MIQRNPKALFDHIMHEEIYESIDAVDQATDFGGKFISNHQVVLGGFEKAKTELLQVQDLIISAKGGSFISAQYGSYIMKELDIFNTIRISDPSELKPNDFKEMKYGGFLTLTQSGNGKDLAEALRMAYKNDMTCFNIVNMENSPITQVIDKIIKEEKDSSDDEFLEKNIGLYQKSGHCYSDVKSFIPQVVCMSLVALWFSDKKQNQNLQS